MLSRRSVRNQRLSRPNALTTIHVSPFRGNRAKWYQPSTVKSFVGVT